MEYSWDHSKEPDFGYGLTLKIQSAIAAQGVVCRYRFDDGKKPTQAFRTFRTPKAALNFCKRYSAHMRHLKKLNTLPSLDDFRHY